MDAVLTCLKHLTNDLSAADSLYLWPLEAAVLPKTDPRAAQREQNITTSARCNATFVYGNIFVYFL